MKSKRLFLHAIPAIVLIINNFACAYTNVIDLGQGSARSVNDNGQIVGGATNNSGQTNAYLFDKTGGGNNINLGGHYAYSINNSGQIVGYTTISFFGPTNNYACLFDPTGQGNNTELGQYSDNTLSDGTAYSINNRGQIAGEIHNNPVGNKNACIFTQFLNLANHNRITYPLNNSSTVYAINDSGWMAGGANFSVYSLPPQLTLISSCDHACLFDPTGGGINIDLGALGTYNISTAYSINNNNQIVGRAYYTAGSIFDDSFAMYSRACLFDSTDNGNNIDLGALDNYTNSGARAINDIGQIVGYVSTASNENHACLFDSTGGGANIDLNSLIDPSSGWTLTYAYDISNNGWIVGEGTFNGQTHAFLLEVPEPATIILLTLGELAVMGRKKIREK
jgi:probable HAF family extracellular repeat protein